MHKSLYLMPKKAIHIRSGKLGLKVLFLGQEGLQLRLSRIAIFL